MKMIHLYKFLPKYAWGSHYGLCHNLHLDVIKGKTTKLTWQEQINSTRFYHHNRSLDCQRQLPLHWGEMPYKDLDSGGITQTQ